MSTNNKPFFDLEALQKWFIQAKRELPWRELNDPYAVWISEVMLQQTQVAVVIPYFLYWMQKFPTIQSLAEAPLDEVIKSWEGLGYYSRARNLHAGAKYVVEHHGGVLPNREEDLKKIKGLGPYTIGAILSFAYHKKISAVDGNVVRVLARYFQIHEDISKQATVKYIRHLAEQILPDDQSWIINEGLIELGALICQKKPQCNSCPLSTTCKGYKNGYADELPVKTKGPATTHLFREVAILFCKDEVLIRKGKQGEIMQDLHEFPYFENSSTKAKNSFKWVENQFGKGMKRIKDLEEVSHSFTRYQVHLAPAIYQCPNKFISEEFFWIHKNDLEKLAFSSGHRRILHQLLASF